MVLDAVICHWVTLLAPTEAREKGIRDTNQELAAFFYVDDRLDALPCPERLHRVLNTPICLFGRLGLCTNVRKMVSMSFHTCYIPGGLLESSYMWRVTGLGNSYQKIPQWGVE